MLARLLSLAAKRSNTALDAERDITSDVTEADFIPYACHTDASTLITKNGELMQVLAVSNTAEGLDYEDTGSTLLPLREAIRAALGEHIESDRFGFWFHILRKRIPIAPLAAPEGNFASALSNAWQKEHRWQYRYVNTVYVSILFQGQSAKLFDKKEMRMGIFPMPHRSHRQAYLDASHELLEQTVNKVRAEISKHYRTEKLAIVDRGGTYYSQPLEFLHYLLNLRDLPMPVGDFETSRQLASDELTFGFDAMESRATSGSRRFAGLLAVKGHADLSADALDRCLQLPEEMIITQSFNYISRAQALEQHKALKGVINASLDPTIAKISGLNAMLDPMRVGPVMYGEQQTMLAVLRDQYKTLDDALGRVQRALSDLGIVTVREDIKLEEAFWSQLPGNFEFLRRKSPLPSERMGGMMRLNHFPSGAEKGERWPSAVAMFPTALNTPYFFNFHVGDTGHTAILDFNDFADARGASLLNFLLAGARRFPARLLVIDHRRVSQPLIAALEGAYHIITPDGRGAALDPWRMEDTPRNRAFLSAWLSHCFRYQEGDLEGAREYCRGAVDMLYALPEGERSLSAATLWLQQQHPGLFRAPVSGISRLFSTQADTIDWNADILGIELEPLLEDPGLVLPVFSYLIHRLLATLDGRPTILVLNEAWNLLDNDFFAPRLESLLSMLTQQNVVVIFTTRHPEAGEDRFVTGEIMRLTPTKLILPDDIPTHYFPEMLGLTAGDVGALKRMERQKGEFLIRHGIETVRCSFATQGLEAHVNALAGDAHSLRLMQIRQE